MIVFIFIDLSLSRSTISSSLEEQLIPSLIFFSFFLSFSSLVVSGRPTSPSFQFAMARVKSCFVKRKQLLERFKEGKEDHVVSPPPFFLSFLFPSFFFFLSLIFSPLFLAPFSSFPSLPSSSGPVFLEVDGVACCVVSGACLQFL